MPSTNTTDPSSKNDKAHKPHTHSLTSESTKRPESPAQLVARKPYPEAPNGAAICQDGVWAEMVPKHKGVWRKDEMGVTRWHQGESAEHEQGHRVKGWGETLKEMVPKPVEKRVIEPMKEALGSGSKKK